VTQERRWYQVDMLCRALHVSRAGYYAWLKTIGQRKRECSDKLLLGSIRRVHLESKKTYGSPRIYRELRENGISCGKSRVERLMRAHDIKAKHKKKFKVTTDSHHKYKTAANLLGGQFEVSQPNMVWVGDITYIHTDEGWLYLAMLLDLYSRRIVGWAMDERMKKDLVTRALDMAVLHRRPAPGLIRNSSLYHVVT